MSPRIRSTVQFFILVVTIALSSSALSYQTHDDHEKQPQNLDEKVRAVHFTPFEKLLSAQKNILSNYFELIGAVSLHPTQAELSATYQNWSIQRDWFAAEFLAMTHVMSVTYLKIEGVDTQLLSLVQELKEMKGDRVYVVLDQAKMKAWLQGPQYFRFQLENRVEGGTMHMGGSQYGGSLHKGFDIQGFTSNTDLPRLQINYLRDGSLGDCDLDAYPPFHGGVIPNPKHLTYENSDSRYWLSKYIKKFGTPGFDVVSTKN